MTFLAAGALAGLALLAPLVILHLRQRSGRERAVPSVLLWRAVDAESPGWSRWIVPPPLPVVLALQALALILLVLAVAGPGLDRGHVPAGTVIVLDDSYWMTAPGALADARREIDHVVAAMPGGAPARIVLAGGGASVIYRGSAAGVPVALSAVHAGTGTPDLTEGLVVGGGLLSGPHDHVLLVRASGDPMPAARASRGELRTLVVGTSGPDQGIFDPAARCGIGAPARCEVTAVVTNTGAAPVRNRVNIQVIGGPRSAMSLSVGAHTSATLHLSARPGAQLHLVLGGTDRLSIDDGAWVTVPGDDDIPRAAAVTIVGSPTQARSLAQAFAAVPGVSLRLETAKTYRASVAQASDLLVLDAPLPHGQLPPTPAVLLVDPRRLPGQRDAPLQADATLSGEAEQSPLLTNADLSSLTLNPGAARRLRLPGWLTPVLWSPSGALLSAGDDGHRRLLVTAFQPDQSTLPQLGAFPVLAANIVRWSLGWVSGSAAADEPFSVDALPGAHTVELIHDGDVIAQQRLQGHATTLTASAPGIDTVTETGPGVQHQARVDVNLRASAPDAASVADIRNAQLTPVRRPGTPLTPWLLAAALLVLALEWAYWSQRRARVFA